MTENDFKEYLKNEKIPFNDEILEKLNIYYNLLNEYNKKFNLTAIINKEDVYLKHFYDSLTLLKFINLSKINNLIDVGTGAGFPGLVLKIFNPDLKLTLLESNNKKISFLNLVVKELSLPNVICVCDRAENYAKTNLNKYDIVVARAVSNLRVLSELCIPLVKEKGYFIAMKGKVEAELLEAEDTIYILNCDIEKVEKFSLPIISHERSLVIIKKNKSSLLENIRNYDKIIKNPLKKNKN